LGSLNFEWDFSLQFLLCFKRFWKSGENSSIFMEIFCWDWEVRDGPEYSLENFQKKGKSSGNLGKPGKSASVKTPVQKQKRKKYKIKF
jgi:hypothetical protein